MEQAKMFFSTMYRKPFDFEHCWVLLKGLAKWKVMVPQDVRRNNPVPARNSGSTISTATPQRISNDYYFNDNVRPIGIKAEKQRRKDKRKLNELNKSLTKLTEKISAPYESNIRLKKKKTDLDESKLQQKKRDELRSNDDDVIDLTTYSTVIDLTYSD